MFHSFYLEPQVHDAIQELEVTEGDAKALQCWLTTEGHKLVPDGLEGAIKAAVELLNKAVAAARAQKPIRVA